MKIGYLRVSTKNQNENRQIDALFPICDELHVEKVSASAMKRPVFEEILTKLKKGDSLVVWSLDLAFRSTKDALEQADHLNSRGIDFHIVSLGVDTSTADGRLAFTVVAAVTEHERNRLSERTKQGLDAARRRGVSLGSKRKLSDEQVLNGISRIENGEAIKNTARRYAVHPWTLTRNIKRVRQAK